MHRFTHKISIIVSACLLGMNLIAGAALAAGPCPPGMCCSDSIPMHMDHCGGMNSFSPMYMKCSDACSNLMCGPLNDPLQDINSVASSPEQGNHYVCHLGMHTLDLSFIEVAVAEPKNSITRELPPNLIPLYITHLSLII